MLVTTAGSPCVFVIDDEAWLLHDDAISAPGLCPLGVTADQYRDLILEVGGIIQVPLRCAGEKSVTTEFESGTCVS
jgi:hypothetical protein